MKQIESRNIHLDGQEIPYTIRVSGRATRYHINVSEQGVEVVLPEGIPTSRAESLLREHSDWLKGQMQKLAKRTRHADLPQLPVNSILYQGKPVTVLLKPDLSLKSRAVVGLVGDRLLVRVPNRINSIPKTAVEAWFREQARHAIQLQVTAWSATFHLCPKHITIRDQRTRWGSCSSRGGLSFNWRLIMVPREVMDYVIIHELSHMDVPNHSTRFWTLVATRDPEYKRHRLWLKHNTHLLHPKFL
jgi:predicted metal-dependent hydrolase